MHEHPEIQKEYELILEALAAGVVPPEASAGKLEGLGLIERGPMGYRMTIAARLMLESYRIKRAQGAASMAVPPT